VRETHRQLPGVEVHVRELGPGKVEVVFVVTTDEAEEKAFAFIDYMKPRVPAGCVLIAKVERPWWEEASK
jgi:hypothetical protein